MTNKSHESWTNFLCDYLPLAVFFIFYEFVKSANPLITATIALMITTLIALIITFILTKKIAKMALFSGLILSVFGLATIISQDEIFIKMKPTIINMVFATTLFYGYFSNKPLLSYLLGAQIKISAKAWIILSWRWAWLFVFLAFLNEIIWRVFSTDFWVQFKVFGMTPISMIFMIAQLPFMMREMKKFQDSSQ